MVRDSGYPCARCNQKFPVMQCSHVKSTGAYTNLRFDPMNVLVMCGRCHNFWWHSEPTESGKWFEKKYPARWDYLEKAKLKVIKRTEKDKKQIRQWIKERNIKKLYIAPELILDKEKE